MNRPLIILDNGHGENTKGKRSPVWADGSQLFEWEFNRAIVDGIAVELDRLNIDFSILVPGTYDIGLRNRANMANALHNRSLLISVHANAGGGTGCEMFTSLGQTDSDIYATILGEEFKKVFPKQKLRTDFSTDGDLDKEAKFTILTKTKMAAVLTENFFMDTEDECKNILMTEAGRKKIIQYHVNAIKTIINKGFI